MNDHFTIDREASRDGVVVRLGGELDLDARDALSAAVVAAVREPQAASVTVDLAAATFLDSEAMAALIAGINAAHQAGKPFHLVNATSTVRRVLEIAGLLDLNRNGLVRDDNVG